MSSYYITLAYSAGAWTPTARNGGSAATGGTGVTIPWVDNTNGGANVASFTISSAFFAALRALQDELATNGVPSARYSINIVDSPSGTFTPAALKDATAAADGTVLTIPHVENLNGGTSTTSTVMAIAALAAFRACLNDRAAGN